MNYISNFDYSIRDKNLLELKLGTYPEYLSSALWDLIRRRVLTRDCCECANSKCPSKRKKNIVKQVHHLSYSKPVLLGISPASLITLCKPCHEFCELDKEGKKLNHRDSASKTFKMLVGQGFKAGVSSPNIGKWYRSRYQMNQEVAREILERMRIALPKWYDVAATMSLEGRFGPTMGKYLGLKR